MIKPYNSNERNWDVALAKRILTATLSSTDPVRLLNAVWAARALQTERNAAGLKILRNVPPAAVTSDIANKHSIYPWELELLANERLAIDVDSLYLSADPFDWNQVTSLINVVRALENEESSENSNDRDIIDHLFKIASRQFEWQQGFLSRQELFRSTFVYGTGASSDFFNDRYGISVESFSAVCFGMLTLFFEHPQMVRETDFSLVGVTSQQRDQAISMVTRPMREMRQFARRERAEVGEMAFKASVLRQFPLISIGASQSRLLCPLPDLLLNRMTSGLFYDVIEGGGKIRAEIGNKFESYVALTLEHLAPDIRFEKEFSYMSPQGPKKSPDIMLLDGTDVVTHLIECKANRLGQRIRFGEFNPDERGYAEMVKGVTQIWRFVAASRQGIAKRKLSEVAVGAVLTLDSWFVAAPKRQEAVIRSAVDLCAKKYPEVSGSDQIPVAFLYMPEFERALAQNDLDAFYQTFRELTTPEKRGFSFDIALKIDAPTSKTWKEFPFENQLAMILPWWGELAEKKAARNLEQ